MEFRGGFGKKRRWFDLEEGREYVVEPMNVLKKKHRGRRCSIQNGKPDRGGNIWVRFADNGRRGKVCPPDLLPTDGRYKEEG